MLKVNKKVFDAARTRLGLTLEKLGHLCGASIVTVSKWRNGKGGITMSNARKLAEALGVPSADLFSIAEPTARPIHTRPSEIRQGSPARPGPIPPPPPFVPPPGLTPAPVPPITFPGWDD